MSRISATANLQTTSLITAIAPRQWSFPRGDFLPVNSGSGFEQLDSEGNELENAFIKFVTTQAHVTPQALGKLLGSTKGTQTTFMAFDVSSPVLVRTVGLWYCKRERER